MRYIVVESYEPLPSFEDLVMGFIKEGYKPVGGVSVVMTGTYGENSIYDGAPVILRSQAMTKDE